MTFFESLKKQRWDDQRFYHHSRINQSLHLVSACSFLVTYVLLFTHPGRGGAVRLDLRDVHPPCRALLLRAQGLRRHEPGHARVQGEGEGGLQPAPQGHPALRLGPSCPCCCTCSRPSSGSSRRPPTGAGSPASVAALDRPRGIALLGRTLQLFFIRDVQTGLVWFTKIPHGPFHDIMLYWRSPLYMMKGELGLAAGPTAAPPEQRAEVHEQHLLEDAALDDLVRERAFDHQSRPAPWRAPPRRACRRRPRSPRSP